MSGRAERRGFALLAAIAVLLAGSLLLLLSLSQLRERLRAIAVRESVDHADLRSDSLLAEALSGWGRGVAPVAVGRESTLVAASAGRVTLERISDGRLLLRAAGAWAVPREPVPATSSVALLLASPDAAAFAAAFPAALTAERGARVDLDAGTSVAGGVVLDPAATLTNAGAVISGGSTVAVPPRLPVAPSAVAAALAAGPPGSALLVSDTTLLVASRTTLTMVVGSLIIASGARLVGPVLVQGTLVVEPGAAVQGAVRVLSGGQILLRGAIAADPAAVRSAFDSSVLPDRPFRAAERLWLPVY